IHFYIQPELVQEVQDTIRQSIRDLGGEIDDNIPDKGYILAELSSPQSQGLLQLFKPDRWVVPFTYVEACKLEGSQLKPIFLEGGTPMPIHIHESIANLKFRATLYEKILFCAGYPYATAETARVIIADSKTSVFNALVKHHQLTPHKYIESLEWVDKSIEKQEVSFTPHVFKNPGGRRAGEDFTEDDEQKLSEWIAAKIPYKSTGGRTGNKLYQQLCEMGNHPEYAWVARHTWQSWRERYKKNATRLDKIIDNIVSNAKPNPGEKWQYGFVRQADEKPKKKRKRPSKTEDDQQMPEFIVGSSGAGQAIAPSSNLASILTWLLLLSYLLREMRKTNGESESAMICHLLGRNRRQMTRERALMLSMLNVQRPSRCYYSPFSILKTNNSSSSSGPPDDHTLQLAMTISAVAGQVVDQGLEEIALQTRFTLEEIHEYYEKCGNLERTKRRFHKMREHLNLLPDEE
ncbi:hypothetical protein BT96DRAFT_805018, partial [Gymnopus androsaceus JB14]